MCAKKSIKADILDCARTLFNQESWSAVSLRRIASELKVSDGNLRYHYRTKEEIVLNLFTAMTTEMAVIIHESERSLDGLNRNFLKIFRIMYRYRFLFIESYFIRRSYESYAILFDQLQESRRDLFAEAFEELRDSGELSSAFSNEQYDKLFEQLFILSDNWIKYLDGDEADYVEAQITHYADLCQALLLPYVVTHN